LISIVRADDPREFRRRRPLDETPADHRAEVGLGRRLSSLPD